VPQQTAQISPSRIPPPKKLRVSRIRHVWHFLMCLDNRLIIFKHSVAINTVPEFKGRHGVSVLISLHPEASSRSAKIGIGVFLLIRCV